MKQVVAGIVSAVVLAVMSGCGSKDAVDPLATSSPSTTASSPSASAPSPSATPPPSTAARHASATSDDPQIVAVSLKSQIRQVGKIVKITEDNDANNLIGRPGQYDAATFMQDTRLPCTATDQFDELSIDCGAKLERWGSDGDAKKRVADIQKKLKDFGLGAEYDFIRDGLVLRVSGDLKPSQAKAYERAFAGVDGA